MNKFYKIAVSIALSVISLPVKAMEESDKNNKKLSFVAMSQSTQKVNSMLSLMLALQQKGFLSSKQIERCNHDLLETMYNHLQGANLLYQGHAELAEVFQEFLSAKSMGSSAETTPHTSPSIKTELRSPRFEDMFEGYSSDIIMQDTSSQKPLEKVKNNLNQSSRSKNKNIVFNEKTSPKKLLKSPEKIKKQQKKSPGKAVEPVVEQVALQTQRVLKFEKEDTLDIFYGDSLDLAFDAKSAFNHAREARIKTVGQIVKEMKENEECKEIHKQCQFILEKPSKLLDFYRYIRTMQIYSSFELLVAFADNQSDDPIYQNKVQKALDGIIASIKTFYQSSQ